MRTSSISFGVIVAASVTVFAQSPQASSLATLSPMSTLPIVFSQTISADRAHIGDAITAKTIQAIHLNTGEIIPSGARVTGHVTEAIAFSVNKTPYAKQGASTLAVHFDAISFQSATFPLNVYVRAMADPIRSWDARKPRPSDEDPDGTLTQVGGELYKPHQGEVINMDEDVVGYSRDGGVVAHLLSAVGNSPDGCDAGSTEQPVAIFSASACGLYGFAGSSLQDSGRTERSSGITLQAPRGNAEIRKNSTALLEVLPNNAITASR